MKSITDIQDTRGSDNCETICITLICQKKNIIILCGVFPNMILTLSLASQQPSSYAGYALFINLTLGVFGAHVGHLRSKIHQDNDKQ